MPATFIPLLARQSASTTSESNNDASSGLSATPTQFVPILVVGLLVILTVAGLFGYRAWKGRQMTIEGTASRQEKKLDAWYNGCEDTNSIEKPQKVALAGDVEAHAGWVPQVRTWRGIKVDGIQLPSQSNASLARSGSIEKKKDPSLTTTPQPSPPPMYTKSRESPKRVPAALPGIPRIPPPLEDSETPIASPLRTVSIRPIQSNPSPFLENKNKSANDILPLPRVMVVQNAFTPSLDDELQVVKGEDIRMLAEYKDGWCVVQRIGSYDSPKGVVPRSCLQECQEACDI